MKSSAKWNVNLYILWKIKQKYLKVLSTTVVIGTLSVKSNNIDIQHKSLHVTNFEGKWVIWYFYALKIKINNKLSRNLQSNSCNKCQNNSNNL